MKRLLIVVFVFVLAFGYITGKSSSKEGSPSASSMLRPRMGTTRDPEFQREYEEAVKRYDQQMRGLPPGLVLPSGETVQERIFSGKVYGK